MKYCRTSIARTFKHCIMKLSRGICMRECYNKQCKKNYVQFEFHITSMKKVF